MIFNPVYGGSSAPNLGSKTITANGTYLASADNLDGYDEVTANVPNTYVASDEDKVVSNGTLVAQTSTNISANGTYDTTLINSVTVDVSGGGASATLGGVIEPDTLDLYNAVTYKSGGLGLSKPYVYKCYNNLYPPEIASAQFDGVSVPCLHRARNDVFGIIFLEKIPKNKYTQLKIQLSLTNSTRNQYTSSSVCLLTEAQFYNNDGWLGWIAQQRYFTSNAMTTAEIEAQSGFTISSSDKYVLSAQTVTWELPTMAEDYYIAIQTWNVESYIRAIWLEGGGGLITKTVTENGTYNASDDNADGYSQVVVNVSGGGGLPLGVGVGSYALSDLALTWASSVEEN